MKPRPFARLTAPLLALVVLSPLLASCASRGTPIAAYENPQKALLVMDMQRDFLASDARMPIAPEQVAPLLNSVNALIERSAREGVLVVYIQNQFDPGDPGNLFRNGAAVRGSEGAELDPRLRVTTGPVFGKKAPDAFTNPELDAFLVASRVSEVTIVGVFADQCCYYTALAALNRGYAVRYETGAVGAANAGNIAKAAASLEKKGAVVIGSPALPR